MLFDLLSHTAVLITNRSMAFATHSAISHGEIGGPSTACSTFSRPTLSSCRSSKSRRRISGTIWCSCQAGTATSRYQCTRKVPLLDPLDPTMSVADTEIRLLRGRHLHPQRRLRTHSSRGRSTWRPLSSQLVDRLLSPPSGPTHRRLSL